MDLATLHRDSQEPSQPQYDRQQYQRGEYGGAGGGRRERDFHSRDTYNNGPFVRPLGGHAGAGGRHEEADGNGLAGRAGAGRHGLHVRTVWPEENEFPELGAAAGTAGGAGAASSSAATAAGGRLREPFDEDPVYEYLTSLIVHDTVTPVVLVRNIVRGRPCLAPFAGLKPSTALPVEAHSPRRVPTLLVTLPLFLPLSARILRLSLTHILPAHIFPASHSTRWARTTAPSPSGCTGSDPTGRGG